MVKEIKYFIYIEFKRYSLPQDQSVFGPIRKLPLHILNELGIIDPAVSYHMEATNDTTPYCYTLHSPTPQPTGRAPKS